MKLIEKLAKDLATGPAPDRASFKLMQLAYIEGFRAAREMAADLADTQDSAAKIAYIGEEDV